MKAWQLAIFLIFLNMSMTLLNEYGVFNNTLAPSTTAQPGLFQGISQNINEIKTGNYNILVEFGLFIVIIFQLLEVLVVIILKSTVLLPFFLSQLGMPTSIILIYTAATWSIYIAGAIQFLSGRSFKQLE